MPRINSAIEAENMVRRHYSNPIGPHPYDFRTYKQGTTWVVKFKIVTLLILKNTNGI
jgi:hypothetical protein